MKTEFWWAIHNIVAHPVSQVLWWSSLCGRIHWVAAIGDLVHDGTIPSGASET